MKKVFCIIFVAFVLSASAAGPVPKDALEDKFIARLYNVRRSFPERIQKVIGGSGSSKDDPEKTAWKTFFESMGVKWPTGSSLGYISAIGKLAVINTAENLQIFERIISARDYAPSQFEIEVQFVAFELTQIAELAKRGMISAGLLEMWKKGDGELIAAPRVITRSGSESVTKGVTEYTYPTEFTLGTILGTNDIGGLIGSVIEPSGFEMREVGVILEVATEVLPEGYMMDITLTPQVVEPPVWKDYGSDYTDTKGKTQHAKMLQPFFHAYSINTCVSLAVGSRILVGGGMPSPDRKKVVYIFLTARRIDLRGREIKSPHGFLSEIVEE